jgi:hypothetical protein
VHTQDAEIVARTKALTVKHISEVLGFLLIEDGATEWTNQPPNLDEHKRHKQINPFSSNYLHF